MDERRPGLAGRLEVGDGRQRLVVDVDEPDGVLGHVAVVGHDERDQLAHVAHLVDRQRPLGPRMGQARMRDQERRGLVELAELGGGQDQVHARQRAGASRVDRADARVRVRAAEAGGVEHAAGLDVVDERAQAAEEPRVLVSRDARADHARRHGRAGAESHRARALSARDLSTGRGRVPLGSRVAGRPFGGPRRVRPSGAP